MRTSYALKFFLYSICTLSINCFNCTKTFSIRSQPYLYILVCVAMVFAREVALMSETSFPKGSDVTNLSSLFWRSLLCIDALALYLISSRMESFNDAAAADLTCVASAGMMLECWWGVLLKTVVKDVVEKYCTWVLLNIVVDYCCWISLLKSRLQCPVSVYVQMFWQVCGTPWNTQGVVRGVNARTKCS